jgi:CBS-domain-containing membrane protein
MSSERESLKPIEGANRSLRRRLNLGGELALAVGPTLTVLCVLGLVEALSRQRLLFASLASSAFLIYLDPQHGTNRVRTLALSQMLAAATGLVLYLALGPGYLSGGGAMLATIVLMILLDAMHPPAVSTALSFAFRAGDESNLLLFGLAVAITAALVVLQRLALWTLARAGGR